MGFTPGDTGWESRGGGRRLGGDLHGGRSGAPGSEGEGSGAQAQREDLRPNERQLVPPACQAPCWLVAPFSYLA